MLNKIRTWLKNNFRSFIKKLVMFFLNPRLLLCLFIGWMITNGWCYLFIFFGGLFNIKWMLVVGAGYAAFLWFPFTPEKIITITIALFLLKWLFPNDQYTLKILNDELTKIKESFKNRKNKKKNKE